MYGKSLFIVTSMFFLLTWNHFPMASEDSDAASNRLATAESGDDWGGRYFKIKVVDEQTNRGVPLVELRTVNELRYYTDSNGMIAFCEPGLMNRRVYFHIRSHGYEYPEDPFGYRGKVLEPKPGGNAVLKIRRMNVAERLYRITGEGIYRDSILTGEKVPLKHPLLNSQVLGQDSVLQELYHGRLFWIWGDTNKHSYPLGNFSSSGATSELPGQGGLDPGLGVDLDYFTGESGFSKRMVPLEEKGMVWLDALMSARDGDVKERLVARFSRMRSLGEKYEQGLVVFNDATRTFERLAEFPLDHPAVPGGHPLRVKVDGEEWMYFSNPFHFGVNLRVKADLNHVMNLKSYEVLAACHETPPGQGTVAAPWMERLSPKMGDDLPPALGKAFDDR